MTDERPDITVTLRRAGDLKGVPLALQQRATLIKTTDGQVFKDRDGLYTVDTYDGVKRMAELVEKQGPAEELGYTPTWEELGQLPGRAIPMEFGLSRVAQMIDELNGEREIGKSMDQLNAQVNAAFDRWSDRYEAPPAGKSALTGTQRFLPISDTEWEWVCSKHGRHCTTCPREETSA